MAHLTQEHVQHLYDTFGELRVLDDVIRYRAADSPPVSILGYPRGESADDYETFTGEQLDKFIDAAAKYFVSCGIKENTKKPVGLFTPSNVDFVVSLFALSRLGCTVLCLSLRLAPEAIKNLLKKTGCTTVVHGHFNHIESRIQGLSREGSLQAVRTPERKLYELQAGEEPRYERAYNRDDEINKTALIMHSSGSTGLPKPVFLSHKNLLSHPVQGAGVDNFGALPLYHLYGISTMLQAMYMRRTAYMFNQELPMTSDNLIAAIEACRPQAIHTVPYALGLLAEQDRGVECLKACKYVTGASSRTPDELGDRLIKAGVNLGVVLGATECGLAGDTMRRDPGDDSWAYIRFYSNNRQFIDMQPVGNGQYESVFLKGHPALSASAAGGEPDGSWRSRDIFEPHPTIPDAWKYITRLDDRVTLINGEKVLPLPIEGRVRECELVREAVVVGIDRTHPGLLVFRSYLADELSDSEYVDAIWPTVQDANSRAEGFSQIAKDMIHVFPSDVEYPHTDKNSIIRAQVYKKFTKQIDDMYNRTNGQGGTLRLTLPELEKFLRQAYEEAIGSELPSLDADFFQAGVDSLKSIQMTRVIQKTLDLGGHELRSNEIYKYHNVKELARYLQSLHSGESMQVDDDVAIMKQLITDHSKFEVEVAILTGATGSLGAHLLAQMVTSSSFRKVYCLVRPGKQQPIERILGSLQTRCIEIDSSARSKIVALTADLSLPDFGLGEQMMEQFRSEVTLIHHVAWPVNFNIPLSTFQPHILGLQNLLKLSLGVRRLRPALLFFSSSISTAANVRAGPVPDEAIEDFTLAASTGYAQSKLVGEHLVRNACRAGARGYVLRIGQIAGDTENGVWNDGEFVPALIRSALTLKKLPMIHEQCSWLPVDTLASAMLELSAALEHAPSPGAMDNTNPPIFYNMVNPHVFQWDELLEELRRAGLKFEAVRFGGWLRELQESATRGEEQQNPAVKLIDYYKQHYAGELAEVNGFKDHTLRFETKAIERDTAVLRSPPALIEGGHIQKFVAKWMQRWT